MRISDWSSDVCSSDLDDFAARLHNLSLRTGAADQPRHAMTIPPACHIALSPWRAACPLLARLATPIWRNRAPPLKGRGEDDFETETGRPWPAPITRHCPS